MKRQRKSALKIIVYMVCAAALAAVTYGTGVASRVAHSLYYRFPVPVLGLPPCPGCNVVIVSLDVFRADNLPCYGYPRNTAPNICGFAARNSYFTRFYSESNYTLDTTFSLFTGLLPRTHHMLTPMKDMLNPSIPTLTQVLKSRGYETVYSGSTDDLNLPLDRGLGRGFDELYTTITSPELWPEAYEPLLSKLAGPNPVFLFMHSYALHAPYLPGHGPRMFASGSFPTIPLTEEEFRVQSLPFYRFVVDEFVNRLQSSDTAESRGRNVHILEKLQRAVRTNDMVGAKAIMDSLYPYEQYNLYAAWYERMMDAHDPDAVAYFQGLYDERIRAVDTAIQPLLEYVSRPEIARRTIFILTSPHGEEFAEHGHFLHDRNIYNSVTHVPFIIAVPKVDHGIRNTLAQGIDIFPTVTDLLGVRTGITDGKSLFPYMQGQPQAYPSYIVGQYHGDRIQSVSDGNWKLYVNNDPVAKFLWLELYDIQSDPRETNNVIAMHPDVQKRLEAALKDRGKYADFYDPVETDFPPWIDSLKRRKLIESGYF